MAGPNGVDAGGYEGTAYDDEKVVQTHNLDESSRGMGDESADVEGDEKYQNLSWQRLTICLIDRYGYCDGDDQAGYQTDGGV